MTFKEFHSKPRKSGYYVVSLFPDGVMALMWEATNHKWYKPKYYEGREEVGYCDSMFEFSHILDVRGLTAVGDQPLV